MKKLFNISALVFTILFCTSAYSQTIAIKAGVNINKPFLSIENQDQSDGLETFIGLNAGIYGEYPLNDMFSIETGFIFSQKGHSTELIDEEFDINEKRMLEISYLDIPLSAKIRHKLGDFTIAASAGFLLSVGLIGTESMEEYQEFPYGEMTRTTKVDVKWGDKEFEYQRLDYGPVFGIEFKFHSVVLSGAYYHGLQEVVNLNVYNGVYKHRVFQVTLGYKISI